MNEQDIQNIIKGLEPLLNQKIKESHSVGLESGGKEISNLADTILHKIEPIVEKSIEKYVNGRVKALDTKFDAYVVKDLEWKAQALPVIVAGNRALTFGSVSIGFLKLVAILGVAVGFIHAFFKWIK